jgi:hypothetical protein
VGTLLVPTRNGHLNINARVLPQPHSEVAQQSNCGLKFFWVNASTDAVHPSSLNLADLLILAPTRIGKSNQLRAHMMGIRFEGQSPLLVKDVDQALHTLALQAHIPRNLRRRQRPVGNRPHYLPASAGQT